MIFSKRLKQLRESKGYTQESLAKKMGITPGAIGLYEQERREPNNETLIALSNVFEVSVDYLLGLEEPRFENSLNTTSIAKKLNTKTEPVIIPYSGNNKIDFIIRLLLNSSIDENDLHIIEAVLDKYKS